MAIYSTNVTATGNTYLCDIVKPRNANNFAGSLNAYGTFGGTTLTLGISTDGGSTVVPLDSSVLSITANGAIILPNFGNSGAISTAAKLYAIATAGTGIDITVDVLDNR